jgi:hypothetical protein
VLDKVAIFTHHIIGQFAMLHIHFNTRSIIGCIVFLILQLHNAHAQSTFTKGTSIISIGYGFPNLGAQMSRDAINRNAEFDPDKVTTVQSGGPYYFKYEYGLSEHFGLGLNVNYGMFGTKDKNTVTGDYLNGKWTSIKFNVRANYYYQSSVDNLDTYTGLGIGYGNNSIKIDTNDPFFDVAQFSSVTKFIPPLGFELTSGARYSVNNSIAIYAEVGIAKSPFQVGITLSTADSRKNRW